MPGTARLMAQKLGMPQVANLGDGQLRQLLLTNHELNYKLGLAYWNEQLATFGGNIGLAAAAYNAGPGAAAKWQKKAIAQFGENFTPEQLASVIGVKETHDYVLNLYQRMGASPSGPGLSATGYYAGANAVDDELSRAENARNQAIKDMASMMRATNDDIVEQMKSGFSVDPDLFRKYKVSQQLAADAGSVDAMRELHRVNQAEAAKPYVDQAYQMRPQDLDAKILDLQTQGSVRPLSELERTQLDSFKAVRTQMGAAASEDPIALGERSRMFRPVTIDTGGSPSDPGFVAALGDRDYQASAARSFYGGSLKPFHPGEVTALKERIAQGAIGDRLALFAAMGAGMRKPALAAAIDQLGLDPVTAVAATMASDRPALARQILAGGQLLKTPGVEKPAKDLRTALADTLGGDLYPPGSPALQQAADAALALYVAKRGGNATLFSTTDSAGLKEAIESVTGELTTINGMKVAAPPSMTASAFEEAIDNLSDLDVAAAGGAVDANGRELPAATIRDVGVLRQLELGGSRYVVGMRDRSSGDGFAPLRDKAGRPLVVDLAILAGKPPASAADRDPMLRAPMRPGFGVGVDMMPGVGPMPDLSGIMGGGQ